MNTSSPFEIAQTVPLDHQLIPEEDYDIERQDYISRAVRHYEAGHWAEARTAALIAMALK